MSSIHLSSLNMNSAEKLGVFMIYKQFQEDFVNAFGPIQNPFTNSESLQNTIYFMLREIDTLQNQGFLLNTIQQNHAYFQRIATSGCIGCQTFESQSFDTQLFLMNLTSFILRILREIS